MFAQRMFAHSRLPGVIEPQWSYDLGTFAKASAAAIGRALLNHGALVFRGFRGGGIEEFDRFVSAVSSQKMRYDYGSTPRTALGKDLYTATEYHCSLEIPMHNECSYQTSWPGRLALCCLVPATEGGETPLADMRLVDAALGAGTMREFEERRVRYVRHYRPHIDVPWQKVFGTDDKETLLRICRQNDIAAQWLTAELLRTTQVCQGVSRHPVTGEKVFFNQAHLFHPSRLGPANLRALQDVYGEEYLPRAVYYGDGEEIDDDTIQAIDLAFRGNTVQFPWRAGDVLLIDNMQVAHGRRPYKGPRKVIAALLDPMSGVSVGTGEVVAAELHAN